MTNANLELMLSEVAFLDAFGATVTTQEANKEQRTEGKENKSRQVRSSRITWILKLP